MTTQSGSFSSMPADMLSVWSMNGEAFDYAEKAYRAWLAGTGGMQKSALEFFRNRLDKSSVAISELGKCKTPVEAFNCQMAYAGDAMADFVAEGVRMGTLLGDVARENLLDVPSRKQP